MTTNIPAAVAAFTPDPRVVALLAALSDAEVEHVLRQMNAAWSPEEDADILVGTPQANRDLIQSTVAMNMAMAPDREAEFVELECFAESARRETRLTTLWLNAMECGAGPEPDLLAETARYLREVGSPPALRFVALLEAGDSPARVELQLTCWMNAGITTHCFGANVTRLSVEHAIPDEMTEAEARAALDAMPTADRLPHWLNSIA